MVPPPLFTLRGKGVRLPPFPRRGRATSKRKRPQANPNNWD